MRHCSKVSPPTLRLRSKLSNLDRNDVNDRYIERPLLLDGYKFDLRLYLVVTSMNPMEAFLYREGFTRMSSEPYRYAGGVVKWRAGAEGEPS